MKTNHHYHFVPTPTPECHCSPCHSCPCKGPETCKVCAYKDEGKSSIIIINIHL